MTRPAPLLWAALLAFGAGWGLMQPINKVVVGAGFTPLTILVWQSLITLAVTLALLKAKGRATLPRGRAAWLICAQIAILGTLIPNAATYVAVGALPAGLMAILLATIPIIALPIGVLMGQEEATARRLLGLALGLFAVGLIAASRGQVAGGALWAVGVALVAPFCYALNSNLIALRGLAGMDPAQAYLGAALIMVPVTAGLALATGQDLALFKPEQGVASLGIIAISAGHTLIYLGFLWLVSQAGAVFASQTAYLVTGFGVFWSALLLGERYPLALLGAGGIMVVGMMLVRPGARR